MSHYMTALAMKQTGLKPAAKIVLYWLADHHNGETGLCCPSLRTLCREAEMSRPSVIRWLAYLEEVGLISRNKKQRENGSQTSTEYILSLTEDQENRRSRNDTGVVKKRDGGWSRNDTPITLEDITLEDEPREEPYGSLSLPVPDHENEAVSIFNEIAEKAGWPIVQKITVSRKSAVKARIRDVGGMSGWQEAIERAARSPLLTGDNNRGWRADFDWLCKPANFTKLMEGNYDPRDNTQRRSIQKQDPALANIARLAGYRQASGDGGS